MSAPYDLSDALKTPPASPSGRPGNSRRGKRPPVNAQLDEFSRKLIWIALAVCGLLLVYQLWGLYSGIWANPIWEHQGHAFRLQQLSNIFLTSSVLRIASIALILAMIGAFHYDEGPGYALLAMAVFLYAGVSLLTAQVFSIENVHVSEATGAVVQSLQSLGIFFGVPGIIWSLIDIARHLRYASETAAIRHANHKYAQASLARSQASKATPRHLTLYQRQQRTYSLLALVVVIGEPLLILANLSTVQDWMQSLLNFTNKLSLTTQPAGLSQLHGSDGTLVLWVLLISFDLVILAQLLKLLEMFIFREKV